MNVLQSKPTDLRDLITGANHIALVVTNLEKSLGFYSNTLGLKRIDQPEFDE